MNREVSALLEGMVAKLDEAVLVEAHQDLIDLMEDVGYELNAETLEEALKSVDAFMESEEFHALSEEEQSKVKKGFKMVFGKLRKIGQGAADKVGSAIGGALKKLGVSKRFRPSTGMEKKVAAHMKKWSAVKAKQDAAKADPSRRGKLPPPPPKRKPA